MKNCLLALWIVLACSGPSLCQPANLNPELCGKPRSFIAPPRGFSVVSDRENLAVKFFFDNGLTTVVAKGALNLIKETCPLPDGRIVVFGEASSGSTISYILDPAKPSLLDSFGGYQMLMSPDQRWIAFRKYYPSHGVELPVSEEYLVYDLSEAAAGNRANGIALSDDGDVGAPIFPLGQKNLPGDNIGVPEDQRHGMASNSFYWSPDSKALAFADSLLGEVSLVYIPIGDSGAPGAFVDEVKGIAGCDSGYSRPVSNVEFGPDEGTDRLIFVSFSPGCPQKPLQLHRIDFQPAKAEVHKPPTFTRKAVKGNP